MHSLKLLKDFKARYPHVSTKSGLMVGLGETDEEILDDGFLGNASKSQKS
jgi:lipoic acid synthetase